MQTRLTGIAALVIAIGLIVAAVGSTGAVSPANQYFERTWERTDRPVADGAVSRTWLWGPAANHAALSEEYAGAPGGERLVQYFDKSRMEITDPNGDSSSIWYVTNGLLVVEMVTGNMQMGDATFEEHGPADVPVAGDGDDAEGPTYATFAGLLNASPLPDEATIVQLVDRDGNVSIDASLAAYGVTAAHRVTVPNIDHQVASPFWEFMNASGTVYQDGGLTTATLFESAFYATGYPITEAYWADVKVGGIDLVVLMQCFERRCLTYTPGNPSGWQVEAGNVGLHYHTWRYGQAGTQTATATVTPASTTTSTLTATATGTSAETPAGTSVSTPTNTPTTAATNTPENTPPSSPSNTPSSTATSPTGSYARVYVTEAGQDRVQVFDFSGTHLFTFGQSGTADGEFRNPYAIAVDREKGFVYVADSFNNRIQKFNLDGQHLLSWNSYYPLSVAIGPDGSVYVTEGDYVIERFDSSGASMQSWGGAGTGDGTFYQPVGLAVDQSGSVFVADTGNDRIQSFTARGAFVATWGSTGADIGEYDEPYMIASDQRGSLYVTDKVNNRVVKTDTSGNVLLSWGGFNVPRGIAVEPTSRDHIVFVADTNNDRVVAFNGETGARLFAFGGRGSGAGEFILPYGVAVYVDPLR